MTIAKQSRRSLAKSSEEAAPSPKAAPSDGAEIPEGVTSATDIVEEVIVEEDEEEREKEQARAISAAGLKAGLAGGVGLLVLRLISLIPSSAFTLCLVVPGIIVVCLSTGMLAGLLAGDKLETHGQAMRAGAWAGFVAGIVGGIAGMVIAAFGAILILDMGEGLMTQFSAPQLESLAQMGILPETIRLAGSVLSALLFCGIGGTATSVILSTLGGRIYSSWR